MNICGEGCGKEARISPDLVNHRLAIWIEVEIQCEESGITDF